MTITLQQRAVISRQWGISREQLDRLEDRELLDLWRMDGARRRTILADIFPRRGSRRCSRFACLTGWRLERRCLICLCGASERGLGRGDRGQLAIGRRQFWGRGSRN